MDERLKSSVEHRPNKIQGLGSNPGMDRVLESTPVRWRWLALAAVAVTMLGWAGYRYVSFLMLPAVPRASVQIATASEGEFQDVINILGKVVPVHTYVLSADEGGRIEKLHVEEGAHVKAGDLLVEISNATLQLNVMTRQTELATQLNQLHANQIAASQRSLDFSRSLIAANRDLDALNRRIARAKELQPQGYISQQDLEDLQRDRVEATERRRLVAAALEQDNRLSKQQSTDFEQTVQVLRKNIKEAQKLIEQLSVRAPISGRLSSLTVEVGQSLTPGADIGRIDDESELKLQADIDQYFIPRLRDGQHGLLVYGGQTVPLTVMKIYPTVKDGQFRVDLQFAQSAPSGLTLGQNLPVQVDLGGSGRALILPIGPYLAQSGGSSLFVLDADGRRAQRRHIQVGRRNEHFVEITSGLRPGERVITSDDERFRSAEKIRLTD